MPEPIIVAEPQAEAGPRRPPPYPWPVLAAVSAGGVVGALARYGLQEAFPYRSGDVAWTTLAINVVGCLLIGVLMTLIGEVWPGRRLLRPFLGVGVLGGFTTFSSYVVDIQYAVSAGTTGTAFGYLAAMLVGAMVAVWIGAAATGWTIRSGRSRLAGVSGTAVEYGRVPR